MMNFLPKHCELILSEEKTTTRRIVTDVHDVERFRKSLNRDCVYFNNGKLKWMTGKKYAVCPGRGKSQVARILLHDIRLENLQDITSDEVQDEGVSIEETNGQFYNFLHRDLFQYDPTIKYNVKYVVTGYRAAFAYVWDKINITPGNRWIDDPLVWVLYFESYRGR